jgi:hypothetical protein
MCFSHAKGHMLILYVGYIKFPANRFIENFCPTTNYPLQPKLPKENHPKNKQSNSPAPNTILRKFQTPNIFYSQKYQIQQGYF